MNEKKDLAKELFNLYENNVNEKKRKKILDGMLDHPFGHVLAEKIFRRVDSSGFLSARNQLMPSNHSDENGAYDSILGQAHCKSILRAFGSEDYVINLLQDEFNRKFEIEPCSLSDIARIIDERHQIEKETAVPGFEASTSMYLYGVNPPLSAKIGSRWMIFEHNDNYDNFHVFKICRASGIRLERLRILLPDSFKFLLLEPFLFMFVGVPGLIFGDSFQVHNLLEPHAAPIFARKNIRPITFQNYESDIRKDGKLPDSVPFLLVYQPNNETVCVECVDIRASSTKTVWTRMIERSEDDFVHVIFIDQNNWVIEVCDLLEYDGKKIYHVVLSEAKITKYESRLQHNDSYYGIFEEMLVLSGSFCEIGYVDYGDDRVFGYFTSAKEENNFEPVCFFEDPTRNRIFKQEILYKAEGRELDIGKVKRISIRTILDFINDKDQEKTFVTGTTLTDLILPLINLSRFGEQIGAEEEDEVIDRSKIGRVCKNEKIQIFI